MKVIGAGYPRTGTMSLKTALNILGYNSYHMEGLINNYSKGHIQMWEDYVLGKKEMDWDTLFEEYDATTDFPTSFFFRELMQKYPDAKLIFTYRDGESWYRSTKKLFSFMKVLRYLTFFPRIGAFIRFNDHFGKVISGGKANFLEDKAHAIKLFLDHNEAVKKEVPADRLLIYQVQEGWEPLCNFLNKPIPDRPFPHTNAGSKTLYKKLRFLIIRDGKWIALAIGLLILIGIYFWIWAS